MQVVAQLALEAGNEFPDPTAYAVVDLEDFFAVGCAPWFYFEAFDADGFVDRLAMGSWLPSDIPLEWQLSWA